MEIRTIIVDDEASGRENLRLLLNRHCPEIKIVAEAQDQQDALDKIKNLDPKLAFLDIRLRQGTIFDMLEQLNKPNFSIIFTTAFDNYAVKAFQLNAIDYLLKPIDPDLLLQSVARFKSRISQSDEKNRIQNLIENITAEVRNKKIALPQGDKTEFVPLKKIIRCQADGNYTQFIIEDSKPLLVTKTLKEFELVLEDNGFIRVHNSHIVSIDKVYSFSKRDGGFIIMSDQSQIPISRNRKDTVLIKLYGN